MRISDCSSDVCSSDLEEMPWLSDVVPFDEMRDRAVLEIGFGPGYDALSFLQAGADYHGIDLTPENIERTRKHLGYYGFEPDVRQGDAEHLPHPDGTFDIVYSNGLNRKSTRLNSSH